MPLDKKDLLILSALDFNGRASFSTIAHQLDLSKEVVAYRVRNLTESGLIKGFYTVVNLSALNYTYAKIYARLNSLEKENEIVDFLVKHPMTNFVLTCKGEWDIIFGLFFKNIHNYSADLDSILDKYSLFFRDKSFAIVVELEQYEKKYLSNLNYKTKIWKYCESNRKLDDLDWKILKSIALNAREPLAKLALPLKISEDTFKYRLSKLIKNKVILGFRPVLDNELFGYQFYKIILYLEQNNKASYAKLFSFARKHSNITYALKMLGAWDMEFECEFKDISELDKLIKGLRATGLIKDYEIVTSLKEKKLNYVPLK